MVAISLYRGNLHRVPSEVPRRWPMPPPAISLRHFRLLIQKRSQTLARLPPVATRHPDGPKEEEGMGDNGCPKPEAASNSLDPHPKMKEEDMKVDELLRDPKGIDDVDASLPNPPAGRSDAPEEVHGSEAGGGGTADAKMEVSNNLDIVSDKEDRKRELEKKLQVLNEKKHHLVQMLKQILNAEEEIKRRSIQSPGLRASIPSQAETAFDMGSVTRHGQKISIEVNFGGDLGGESDAAAYHGIHPPNSHPMHSTSPSAASLTRPTHGSLQHNMVVQVLHNPRGSMAAAGHGQTAPNAVVGNAADSPSRFAPTPHLGHSTSLPTVSVPGPHATASTPSPVASGGALSFFWDSRMTNSS